MEIAERASKVPVVTEKKAPVPVPKPIVVRPQPVKTCAATSRPSVVAVVPVAPIRSRIPSTMVRCRFSILFDQPYTVQLF